MVLGFDIKEILFLQMAVLIGMVIHHFRIAAKVEEEMETYYQIFEEQIARRLRIGILSIDRKAIGRSRSPKF